MSHVLAVATVNQFLPATKLAVADHAEYNLRELEESARDVVKSRLSGLYDVSTWTGLDSYPSLVENIMGMLVAGWIYNKQFSDESVDDSYGERRLREAYDLLNGIIEGHYNLDDATLTDVSIGQPTVEETEPVFEMGTAF